PKVIFISMQGEKNNGFDILYHNMKHGVISVKSLQDLFRESATTEDLYAKHLTKLAKQAANSSPLGTFAPMFEVVRVMSEKLSSCHMDIVHKLHEIIKDLAKYLEEQKNKHKQVKDELSGTADALHHIQTTTAARILKWLKTVMCMLLNGIHSRQGMINQVDSWFSVKNVKNILEIYLESIPGYCDMMRSSNYSQTFFVQRFQEIEEAHLRHMKSVLDNYILSFENANVLVNQVHQEFRRQVDENTIASLIKQYSESKGTGFEKPAPTKSRIPNLPFRRKRQRKNKEMVNGGSTTSKDTGTDKDVESILVSNPACQSSAFILTIRFKSKMMENNIDEDGYTIVPDAMKNAKNSWTMDSGDSSDSDSDDYISRKIHVKIKPKETTNENSSNLDTLNAVTRNLTLNSPTPLVNLSKLVKGRRSERATRGKNIRSPPTRTFSQSDKLGVGNSPLTLSPSPETPSSISPNPLTPSSPTSSNSPFTPKSIPSKPPITQKLGLKIGRRPPSPRSFSSSSAAPPPPRKSSSQADSILELYSTKPDSPATAAKKDHLTTAPIPQIEKQCACVFASSRGPSPLTLMHGDPIPIAVAFTETAPYKRQFKPPTPLWCMVKITGDMQMSFPAGIVRAFTSNPNPAALSFKVKGVSNIKDFAPNASLIMADSSQTEVDSRSFFFNMSALVSHVKKMTDSNPNSPYYNIPVMSYQLSSAAGYDMVPLHISSTWVCDMQSTDICIDYKYVCNPKLHTPVKNIQVIVPVDGGVTNHQSVPQATWVSSQNRLSWKLPTPISSSSSPGSLKSTLSLSSGPSKPTTLAVQFVSEGVTLTGADFELTGTGYRISLIKRRFVSGLLGFLT
uniref:MHD domain-containing protein n=1 Tax=Ciona savignyi TaxID=51511 RepID=H2YU55_CIOSA